MIIFALSIVAQEPRIAEEAKRYGITINPDQGTIATRDQVIKLGGSANTSKCRMEIRRLIRAEKTKLEAARQARQTALL